MTPADELAVFAAGRREIAVLLSHLRGHGLVGPRRCALDFGCGIGRATQALADHYEQAVGVDASPDLIRLARRYERRSGKRCRYVLNRRPHLGCLNGQGFDLVYTAGTFAYLEPAMARGYLREFLRLLTPGGVTVFQLEEAAPGMVAEIVRANGGRVVQARPVPAGSVPASWYCVVRQA